MFSILCISNILLLTGCLNTHQEKKQTESSELTVDTDYDLLDISSMETLRQTDNSKDKYKASFKALLPVEKPKAAEEGGANLFLLEKSQAIRYKKHLFTDYTQNWDELALTPVTGEGNNIHYFNNQGYEVLGEVLQSDKTLALRSDYNTQASRITHELYELSENCEQETKLDLEFSSFENQSVNEMMRDANGYTHFITYPVKFGENEIWQIDPWYYMIFSPTGELVYSFTDDKYRYVKLCALYNGSVGLYCHVHFEDNATTSIIELANYDFEISQLKILTSVEQDYPDHYYYCFTLKDANTIIYGNKDGIFQMDINQQIPVPLYLWVNHGMIVSDVLKMTVEDETRISIIAEDSKEKIYMLLEPVTEQVEVREITMAVSPSMKQIYSRAAAEFNKKYPTCHVKLEDDYDKVKLLTELIAGDGPVLIDTTLTGFWEQKTLWEPLDYMMELIDVKDKLVKPAKELGEIDGNLYGIVTTFSINTVVTADSKLSSWDYDLFLQKINENKNLKALCNSYDSDGRWEILFSFFIHNTQDNYFLDEQNKMCFRTDKFKNTLEIMEKYGIHDAPIPMGGLVDNGEVLCNTVNITRPEQIALCRMVYGESINYIGYPSVSGSKHYAVSNAPITVRRTASKSEKELALAFFQILLSYENQVDLIQDPNFYLSVRSDVLQEQIENVNEDTLVEMRGFSQVKIGTHLNQKSDGLVIDYLLDNATPARYVSEELMAVFYEEFTQYFNGTISEDMLMDHLDSRVGLYYKEQ